MKGAKTSSTDDVSSEYEPENVDANLNEKAQGSNTMTTRRDGYDADVASEIMSFSQRRRTFDSSPPSSQAKIDVAEGHEGNERTVDEVLAEPQTKGFALKVILGLMKRYRFDLKAVIEMADAGEHITNPLS